MGTLYIVGTPIGNLKDISFRGLKTLKDVDLILCEDTRVTKKLLERYQIKTPTLSYHQHSGLRKIDYIIGLLEGGKNLALVSDAGTPGISDPGGKLVCKALESAENCSLQIVPVPGPSAIIASASISGFKTDRFLFLGFPPAKKKRKKFFEEVFSVKYPVIFYESSHRIIKTLKELGAEAGNKNKEIKAVVCRELTKKFETIYRGKIDKIIGEIEKEPAKGEFVVIISS